MAAADHDIKALVGVNRAQSARDILWRKRVDATEIDGGSGAGAGESAEFVTVPAGTVVTGVDSILRTAEGATQTIDIGDETDPDGWLDGGNANGTPDALIAKAGTEAYSEKLYSSDTGLRMTFVNACDAAVVDVCIRGYTVEDRANG
jgi:hypothetical protein